MKWLWIIGILCCTHALVAQYHIIGFVYDADEQPFIGAEVQLKSKEHKAVTQTDREGRFEFHDIPRDHYKLLIITEYGLIEKKFQLRTSLEMHLQRPRNIKTDEIVVRALRADANSPVNATVLDKEEIQKQNVGLDVPYALNTTPSVVATSDAGTGIGYTGMRIRGVDPTRVNVTINGVPLNDTESQAVFWVDLPDLLSSAQSIQIQRGVGSSTFGTGAFGASVNINTTETRTKPYLRLSGGAGSFNTYKGTVEFGSGLLNNHFTVDGRLSTIQSDGYIDRASADLRSYFGSVAWIGDKTSLRFTSFGGKEVTYQAWYGVPSQYIDDPELRTFNIAGMEKSGEPYDNEVDDYTQTHYQLQWNASVFTQLQTYVTAHYTRGKGFYEQYKNPEEFESTFAGFLTDRGIADGDVIRRRWLDNHYYGIIGGLHWFDPGDKYDIHIAGAFSKYDGLHFGEVIHADAGSAENLPPYYENDAEKTDNSFFLKLSYKLSDRFTLMTDLQLRNVDYTFVGLDSDSTDLTQDVDHSFFNPKVGLTYRITDALSAHYFVGIANREPNRDDYVASTIDSRPEPERLIDNEISLRMSKPKLAFNLTGYYMRYKDQLALTGEINDVGEYTRQNVDQSHRLGVELSATVKPLDKLTFAANATFSENKIDAFTEYIDNWDSPFQDANPVEDSDLAFSPSTILGGELAYQFLESEKHKLSAAVSGKYVGEQYIDNTGNPHALLDAYGYANFRLHYTIALGKQRTLAANVMVRNLFDAQYSSNAWIYRFRSASYDPRPDDPYSELESGDTYHLIGYFPQAGRNVLFGLTLSL